MKKLRLRVERSLAEGAALNEPLSGRCTQLLAQRTPFWTFVRHEGLEPQLLPHRLGLMGSTTSMSTRAKRGDSSAWLPFHHATVA